MNCISRLLLLYCFLLHQLALAGKHGQSDIRGNNKKKRNASSHISPGDETNISTGQPGSHSLKVEFLQLPFLRKKIGLLAIVWCFSKYVVY